MLSCRMITNFDIFQIFYQAVKDSDNIVDVIKEYVGGSIYIPSHKRTYRNVEIKSKHIDGKSVKSLAIEYDLSESQIRNVIKCK